ncbi:Os01g0123000 [Oryza sativa Japonica Group]|uniref:Os01g0123000 protein n=2 Tax=Oryza sativa subsp. japonica TaxID=39947 RepID=B7EZP3_ORYSJ|nr:Os01g0123000 [Oryza sativa Japonica Group]BAG97840.1 unnamed protein product [Oryza sativa Japonica Group]|eukprot:NP_001041883.1 Os01g0123000 [Oryza sativa Japonica Group]
MASSSSSIAATNPLVGIQVSEKLTKQNYALWSAQVLTALRGARLEGFISGKTTPPPAEIEKKEGDKKEGEKTIKIANPAVDEWFATDQQVLGFLFSSLSREILSQVAGATTAAQAWQAISDMFASKSRAGLINMRLALTSTQKGTMSVTEYVAKMRAIADELAAAGKPIDQDDLIAYIINGLDANFDPVVEALVARVEPITVQEMYSHLLNFENKIRLRQAFLTASTNAANRNNVTRGGRGGMPRGRGGRGGGGRGGNGGRGNNGGGRGDNRPTCQVCNKRGHVASDCWHRFDETYVPDEKIGGAATHAYGIDTNWYVDTGATDHITSQLDKLTTKEKYQGTDQIHTASGEGQGHEENNS